MGRFSRLGFGYVPAAFLAVMLVACGGGGGDGSASQNVTIKDSFGNVVFSGLASSTLKGRGGIGAGDAGADGTAGDGAPIPNATVTLTDSNNVSVTSTTDATGYYSLKITGLKVPFVAKVVSADGTKTRYSLNINPTVTNGFVNINLTGLTSKIASDVSAAGGQPDPSKLTPQIVAANSGAITKSIADITNALSPVIKAAGIDTTKFNPLNTPFKTDGTGYDFVLDNSKITTGADGSVSVAVSPTFVTPTTPTTPTTPATPTTLQGNWRFDLTGTATASTNGGPATTVPISNSTTIPASSVPPSSTQFYGASPQTGFCSSLSSAFASSNSPGNSSTLNSCSVSGNTVTYSVTTTTNSITVTTNSTETANTTSYSGCGSCGVNSQIIITATFSGTSTTVSGSSSITIQTNGTETSTYTRIN